MEAGSAANQIPEETVTRGNMRRPARGGAGRDRGGHAARVAGVAQTFGVEIDSPSAMATAPAPVCTTPATTTTRRSVGRGDLSRRVAKRALAR
jgi:hypothetical protein